MMNNLFSIFDSATNSSIEMNWVSSLTNLLLIPFMYWLFNSRLIFFTSLIILKIFNELKIILNNKFNSPNIIVMISVMLIIFFNNFMGMFPYIFTSSSHLIFAMSFSFPLWFSYMLFGWYKNYNFMFSHMIPHSTPFILMPFMVMIETISNIIRPLTLAIRLTANMIAGHLLLTLLSQSCSMNNLYLLIFLLFTQIILLTLEFSVSIIQSYVFTILSTLYSKETNYD